MTDFDEIHDELREVARSALARDDDRSDAAWRQAAELGWLSLEIPEALGGSGATFAETAVVLEELGRAAAPGPFLGTVVLGVGAALAVQDGPGPQELLRGVAEARTRVAVALAPTGDAASADPPFSLRSGRLHGLARHVVDAPSADQLLLLAVDDASEPVLVCVDRSDLLVSAQPVLDVSRDVGTVEALDVTVSDHQVWRFAGDPHHASRSVFDRGATALAVDAIGVASAMLDATVEYVGVRRQFGRQIGSFQAVKHQCADVLVDLTVGRELIADAVGSVCSSDSDETDAAAHLGVAASRAKSFLGDVGVAAVGTAMQLHGGIGYTWESGVHRYLKRALFDRALLGSPEEHRLRLGERFRLAAVTME